MKRDVQNTKIQTPNTNKGITLIALVITIIVLLILAGVAINMAIDSDGLFGKANEAAEKWNTAIGEEQSHIQSLLDKLTSTLPEGWDSTKVDATVTETSLITGTNKERVVPIPKGFVASQIEGEDTIAGGLVIYEGTNAVTGDRNGTEHTTAMTTRNQYVWIPVDDINYMVMCKSNASDSVCNLALQTDGTLKCVPHNSTDLCGRLYGGDPEFMGSAGGLISTTMTFTAENRANQTWNTDDYHEPNIVSEYDTDETTGGLTAFTNQMTQDFIDMATSVAKYGGFYVGRYEAGANGAGLKNQKVLVAGDSSNYNEYSENTVAGNSWYGLYNTLNKEITVDSKVILQSHMIYGSQYDQIIHFLETNEDNEPQIGHSDRQLTTQVLTGSNEADVMSNIYDLEGNNGEWIATAASTYTRTFRGGGFLDAGNGRFGPASIRSSYIIPTYADSDIGSRPSLFIK